MEEDLLLIAKELELQVLQKNKGILLHLSGLEEPLNHIYGIRHPSPCDYHKRRDLIRKFNEMAREIYGNEDQCPVVEEFGSFLMDMFNAKSDLDLSINFPGKDFGSQRAVKIKTLQKFADKLRALQKSGHVENLQSILSARVPVVKVTDRGTGIDCDLSVGNLEAIAKSHIILIISAIDERFHKLCFLMKTWAHAHGINSSRDGTLNSLSLVLLVTLHLQTRNPPILPPFSAILKEGTDLAAVKKIVHSFLNYGKENKESLAQLFVSLLMVLESAGTLWPSGLCASVFEGSWVRKKWLTKKGREKMNFMSIEDFIDQSNTARAVSRKKVKKIYSCIHSSLEQIRCFVNGKIDAVELKNRLLGPDSLTVAGILSQHTPSLKTRKRLPKKMRLKLSKKSKPNVNSRLLSPSSRSQRGAVGEDSLKGSIDQTTSSRFSDFIKVYPHHKTFKKPKPKPNVYSHLLSPSSPSQLRVIGEVRSTESIDLAPSSRFSDFFQAHPHYKDSKNPKPIRYSFLHSTSSQGGAIGVDRSNDSIDLTLGTRFSHFSQAYSHDAPYYHHDRPFFHHNVPYFPHPHPHPHHAAHFPHPCHPPHFPYPQHPPPQYPYQSSFPPTFEYSQARGGDDHGRVFRRT